MQLRTVESGHVPSMALACSLAITAFAIAGRIEAGNGIININQHRVGTSVVSASDCSTQAQNRPEPPYQSVFDHPEINAMSYHAFPCKPEDCGGGVDHKDWPFWTARCYNNHGHPRIIDDDADFAGSTIPDSPKDYIRQVCLDFADPRWPKGHTHFEHFDQYLDYRAKQGEPIDEQSDWPVESRDFVDWLRDDPDVDCNDLLDPNGTLVADEKLLKWNGQPITLIGYGYMGALTADSRLSIEPYFRALRSHEINFTRVWAIEQWVGEAVCPPGSAYKGLTPFSGSMATRYNLESQNPYFYARLRQFAQAAADRGVVVQLSLWDKHGLNRPGCDGHWRHSPFNSANNTQGWLFGNPGSCSDCSPCQVPGTRLESEEPLACQPLAQFISEQNVDGVNRDFLRRVAKEVGGTGNVIFEIMNEPRYDQDWATNCSPPGCTPGDPSGCECDGEGWQISMAEALSAELPIYVARDAFNAEPYPRGINGKTPDAGSGNWVGGNTWVGLDGVDPETNIRMGMACSREQQLTWSGLLSLGNTPVRHELGVRATTYHSVGSIALGFSTTNSVVTGDLVWVEIGQSLLMGTQKRLAVVKRIGGQKVEIASTTIAYTGIPELQLLVDLDQPGLTASVYFRGALVIDSVALGIAPIPQFTHGFFHGGYTSIPTPGLLCEPGDNRIDNFELSVY